VLGFSLPIGVQLIAPPWREDLLFRAAAALEALGVCGTVTPIGTPGGH
jgi:Asp-tRNA(Asn)/Glu-tRNA(Gln) amidotransferase A subunit family amidase